MYRFGWLGLEESKIRKGNLPEHFRYINPILEVLKEIGGSGKISEVIDLVVEKLNISDEELRITIESGQQKVINQIHWAKLMLVKTDHLDSSRMGVWNLTIKGMSAKLSKDEMMPIWELIMSRASPKSRPKV
jgi:restriction system protein